MSATSNGMLDLSSRTPKIDKQTAGSFCTDAQMKNLEDFTRQARKLPVKLRRYKKKATSTVSTGKKSIMNCLATGEKG